MTAENLAPQLTTQFFSNTGAFLAGGQLFSYQAGTTTPVATYTDSTGGTPNANPIVLNARGECSVWLTPNVAYKFVLQDAAGNTIWTRDQVVNAQLVTYYGVDTGAANTYIVTAATPYTSYQNGLLLYFVASNANTGPSTINLNGLGPIPIINPNGSALGANQILAGSMTSLIYFNGSFQVLTVSNFTGVTVGTFGAEVPIASAATTDLGTIPAHVALITGTTTITSLGTSANLAAPIYLVRFAQALTLTYNSSSLILPGNASIITLSGDAAMFEYLGGGNWKCLFYQSSGGQQNARIKPGDTTITSSTTLTPDPDLQTTQLAIGRYSWEIFLIFDSVAAGAGFKWSNDGTAVDSRGVAPALASGFVNGAAYGPKSETPYGTTITYATVTTGANSNEVLYKGSLLVATPGTFGVTWAQSTLTASATTLRGGSYLITNLLNTGASSGIITRIYQTPGAGVETIPTGYNTLIIECWGGTGGGGLASGAAGGGGGGSGGYSRTSISVTGMGGNTINYTVGAAGIVAFPGTTSSVSSGTFILVTMTSNGGAQGTSAAGPGSPGAGGAGGTASGGTATNIPGNSGAGGMTGGQPTGGNGANGIPGIYDGGGGGGTGGGSSFAARPGNVGIVLFSYS